MSINSVNRSTYKASASAQQQNTDSVKSKTSLNFDALRKHALPSANKTEEGAKEGVKLSSEATLVNNTGFKSSQKPFTITDASVYKKGSDVQEMAYALAGSRDRDDVDLSDYTVLKASDKDNQINISKRSGGGLVVTVDGQEQEFTGEEARRLIIDGGNGNDNIVADEDLLVSLHIVGGRGDDTIVTGGGNDIVYDNYGANNISTKDGNDTVIANQLDYKDGESVREDKRNVFQRFWDKITGNDEQKHAVKGNTIDGGDGDDYLEGGLGQDTIKGGAGNDVIYGLDGDDKIDGGAGDDYIDGGRGNDKINGGAGNDKLFGGVGNDTINGGKGNDVIAGGAGEDTINAGVGANKITADKQDTVNASENSKVSYLESAKIPGVIKVKGNEGFTSRVQSDLDTLASIKPGQAMYKGLSENGRKVTIKSTDAGNVCYYNGLTAVLRDNGKANFGSSSTIAYNRARTLISYDDWGKRPPVVGMFHEMSHSYDAGAGILDDRYFNYDGTPAENDENGGVKAAELQAVGLGEVTDQVKMNPEGISENDLRAALDLERRNRY